MRTTNPQRDLAEHQRVLVVAVHPARAASTRVRTVQFADRLRAHGIEMELWSFIRDRDLQSWYFGTLPRRLMIVMLGFLRCVALARRAHSADVILLHKRAVPVGPPLIESLLLRCKPSIWDVDDAVWKEHPGLVGGALVRRFRPGERTYAQICAAANEVWAGNEYLAQWCRRHNAVVREVPSTVEVPGQRRQQRGRTIGWIGSPSTGQFLERVLPSLVAVPAAEIVIVGAHIAMQDSHVRVAPWSPQDEEDALAVVDVGVYPVDAAHPLALGKCGYKALLFMSRGIPTVVTPTPVNARIVREGIEGRYAHDDSDWTREVSAILDDRQGWERMSRSSLERVEEHFSTAIWTPLLAQYISQLARRDRWRAV